MFECEMLQLSLFHSHQDPLQKQELDKGWKFNNNNNNNNNKNNNNNSSSSSNNNNNNNNNNNSNNKNTVVLIIISIEAFYDPPNSATYT